LDLRPIAFVVMPFGKKPTGYGPADDAPTMVDFDRLWLHALKPLLEEDLGYCAVRADQDLGSCIVRDMIERLALSDLVVADLSILNANVYYEVGVRQAARAQGCVLVAAAWSRQPFDTAQMRHAPYPLRDGGVSQEAADAVRAALRGPVATLRESRTPCHELEGFPGIPASRAQVLREAVARHQKFATLVDGVRLETDPEQRKAKYRALSEKYLARSVSDDVALEFLLLVRDGFHEDGASVIELITTLPESIGRLPVVQEQRCLALSNIGKHREAIAELTALVQAHGETPERLGLLGGRWKRLYGEARAAGDTANAARFLNHAIDAYERAMMLDLNEYYAASNLPRLLRSRSSRGDQEKATRISGAVVLACERKRRLGREDEWVLPTLLGAAFDAGDVEKAEALCEEIERGDLGAWKLETTLRDLRSTVSAMKESAVKASLATLADRLAVIARDSAPH
jgi:hypothetical protein